jgi:hypothetical protein
MKIVIIVVGLVNAYGLFHVKDKVLDLERRLCKYEEKYCTKEQLLINLNKINNGK